MVRVAESSSRSVNVAGQFDELAIMEHKSQPLGVGFFCSGSQLKRGPPQISRLPVLSRFVLSLICKKVGIVASG